MPSTSMSNLSYKPSLERVGSNNDSFIMDPVVDYSFSGSVEKYPQSGLSKGEFGFLSFFILLVIYL
jgi:hypothetical protein